MRARPSAARTCRCAAALLAAVLLAAGCAEDEAPDSTERDVTANLELVAGLTQRGVTLGRPGAPATLVVYDSLDVFNRGLFLSELPSIVADHVRPGDLRLELRTVTTSGSGEREGGPGAGAAEAARVAQAAALQDRMWDFYGALGARYIGVIDEGVLAAALADVKGLDVAQVRADARSREVTEAIEAANDAAAEADVGQLPAYAFRRGPGAKPVALDASCVGCLARAVDREMAKPVPSATPTRTPTRTPQRKRKRKRMPTPGTGPAATPKPKTKPRRPAKGRARQRARGTPTP